MFRKIMPADGIYARQVHGLIFKNVRMATATPTPARPRFAWMSRNDPYRCPIPLVRPRSTMPLPMSRAITSC